MISSCYVYGSSHVKLIISYSTINISLGTDWFNHGDEYLESLDVKFSLN